MRQMIQSVLLILMISSSLSAQKYMGEEIRPLFNASLESYKLAAYPITWKKTYLNSEFKIQCLSQLKYSSVLPDSFEYAIIQQGEDPYFILIDEAPSKSARFTYVIILDQEFKIHGVDVLQYNEQHGSEIDLPFFRAQFTGIQNPKKIRFNRTIQGISGATISSKSITYAVRDMLTLFRLIHERDSE